MSRFDEAHGDEEHFDRTVALELHELKLEGYAYGEERVWKPEEEE